MYQPLNTKQIFFKKNIVCMLLLTWPSSQQLEVCNMLFLRSRHGPFFYSLLHCNAFSSHGRWYQLSSTILLGLLNLGIDWESDWPSQSNIKRSIFHYFGFSTNDRHQYIFYCRSVKTLTISVAIGWFLNIATMVISIYKLFLVDSN